MSDSHRLLARLLARVGATADTPPTADQWRELLALVARTYRDTDQDRYTIERSMEISSREMHELNQQLRRRAEHDRFLFESNPLPMWVTDLEDGRLVDVNAAMITTYGYTREELLAMRASELGLRTPGLHMHTCKGGEQIEMDVAVHAVQIDDRPSELGIALDMTEIRRVENELRHAQKMEAIGRLAGGVAHDFNNLLAVILTNADYALEELAVVGELAEVIGELREAAIRASGLTRQLLTFSRKQKRQPKPLALNAVVTAVKGMLARMVGEDVAFVTAVAPDVGTIEADPGEVEQVLFNLVVNARDAMPDGGHLRIETANVMLDHEASAAVGVSPGRYVVLSVRDSGCGMTDDVRARVFEPFFTTKAVDQGTGLGLSTVFGIVTQGGGGIAVDSTPGTGTTFRIYWPRIDAVPIAEVQTRTTPARGAGVVLVVEDDRQLRRIITRYLASWGYTLLEAGTGAAAIQVAAAHSGKIDVLLTDLVMPGLDGRELSEAVLAVRPETKIVFMSGYTEHPALASAKIGPDDLFVQKPFTAQTLADTLRRALASRPT